jgi:peptide/nickel transport system substrate-binding protein
VLVCFGVWSARPPWRSCASVLAAAPTAASRQVLTVAATADGYYENPQYPTIGRYPTNANIFETLVRMTPDYQLAPSLATSWEFLPPNTWRFQLRKNVKFQDGTPFTAKAVEFTIKQIGASGQGDYSA